MRWADVPGYEGYYEVSDTGVVRSKDRITSHGHKRKGVELKPSGARYAQVILCKEGKISHRGVHRLVLLAFVGEPEDPQSHAMHLNNDTFDNRLENLKWGSNSENQHQSSRERRHQHSRKDCCNRGHLLEPPNLRPNTRGRECWACAKARDYARRRPDKTEQLIKERADYYYEKLRRVA